MQDARKYTINQHAPGELVAFLSAISLSERSPALPIVRNTIGSLGDGRLKNVPEVRAQVPKLVPGNVVFSLYGQRALVFRLIVCRHEVGNDPENPLRHFVIGLFILWISGRFRSGISLYLGLGAIWFILSEHG